jgi:GNAT superfamily N-acetyltransferase
MSALVFQSFQANAVEEIVAPLSALRMAVFRDFPYLYEGSLAYETDYLQTYVRSTRSLVFAVFDGSQLVGATTCLPLADETADVQAPFIKAQLDLKTIFYFGESILLPQYRGLGIGHRFFDERERHARSFGSYAITCFCAVVRAANHPLRPTGYRPLEPFWQKRGYQPAPMLQSTFEWPDVGETVSSPKVMKFWMRPL